MDKHYLTPLFNPASVVVFAGKVDDPTTQTPQAVALLEALHAPRHVPIWPSSPCPQAM